MCLNESVVMQIRKHCVADCTGKEAITTSDNNDDEKRKIFCGNLSEKVTEAILFELFLQAGPVEIVEIPKAKDGRFRNYAFITYVYVQSVPYALRLFADVKLYNRKLVLRHRTLTSSNVYGTKTQTNKQSNVSAIVNKTTPVSCADYSCRNSRKTPQNSSWLLKNKQLFPRGKNEAIIQKAEDAKPTLPRTPLRVNNECSVPKKILASSNDVYPSMSHLSRICAAEHNDSSGGMVCNVTFTNQTNVEPRAQLTSQFLSNYIYLMQKVIPQWPRFQ